MKRLSVYVILLAFSSAFGFAKFVFFARSLDAAAYGFYSLVLTTNILILYIASFGANEAMLKLGAIAFGKKEYTRIVPVRDAALVYGSLSIAIFGMLISTISSLFLSSDTTEIIIFSWILAVFAFQFQIFDAYFRARQMILVFSSAHFSKSLLTLVIGAALVQRYGARGVILAEMLSTSIAIVGILVVRKERIRLPNFSNIFDEVTMLARNGFSLLSSSFLRYSTLAIDRWAVTASLGLSIWGAYSFVMIIFQMGTILIGLIGNVMGPRWLASFSDSGDKKKLLDTIAKFCFAIVVISLFLIIPLVFALPDVMERYFKAYIIENFMIVVAFVYVGVVLYCINCLLDWFFISTSREHTLTVVSSISLVVTCIGTALLMWMHATLAGFAALFLISRSTSLAATVVAIRSARSKIL